MHIQLYPTACLNEVGKRENNEDSIYPKAGRATRENRLFMVCDGVGGSAKGEQASKLACESFVVYCQQNNTSLPDAAYINAALQYTEAAFDAHLAANADSKNMGTTVTLLCLHEGGITAAHIGDSRIYHVRKGKIMWCTSDHSLVNDYLKAGILTPEDAVNHPQKNVITRALQGTSVRPTRADVHIITDVAADDFIFMCSDGILESITDDDLCRILGDSRLAIEDQIAQIHNHCNSNSRDNFSCYLLKIASVEGSIIPQYGLAQTQTAVVESTANQITNDAPNQEQISIVLDDAPRFTLTDSAPNTVNAQNTAEAVAQTSSNSKFMYIALGIILLGLLAFAAMNFLKTTQKPPIKPHKSATLPPKPAVIVPLPAQPALVKPANTNDPVSSGVAPAQTNRPGNSTSTNTFVEKIQAGDPVVVTPAPAAPVKTEKPKTPPSQITKEILIKAKNEINPQTLGPQNEIIPKTEGNKRERE